MLALCKYVLIFTIQNNEKTETMTTLAPFFNQFDREAINNQLRANVIQLEQMKVKAGNGKYRGFTASQLQNSIDKLNNNIK